LKPDSLAQAIIQYSEAEGVTEKAVAAEIGLFFVAGMYVCGSYHVTEFYLIIDITNNA
jgi:hypothetical protein